jgi:hypothetical protein
MLAAGSLFHRSGDEGSMRTVTRGALLLLLAAGIGCATYNQSLSKTKSIWSVKVTTSREDVKNCRHLAYVDSTDTQKGCGLTAQPTPEECLRYQVLAAGGDTLLAKGFVGEAYLCSAAPPTPSERSAAPEPAAARAPSSVPPPPPTPAAVPAPPSAPVPSPTPEATPAPAPPIAAPALESSGVRLVPSLEAVKGCVYLDEIDMKTECPAEGTGVPISCISERAARAGGNRVLLEGDRALIFSCEPNSQ